MTDRDAIMQPLKRLVAGIGTADLKALHEALGKAQNGPPDGAADGTIDAAEWKAASDIARALARAASLYHGVLNDRFDPHLPR